MSASSSNPIHTHLRKVFSSHPHVALKIASVLYTFTKNRVHNRCGMLKPSGTLPKSSSNSQSALTTFDETPKAETNLRCFVQCDKAGLRPVICCANSSTVNAEIGMMAFHSVYHAQLLLLDGDRIRIRYRTVRIGTVSYQYKVLYIPERCVYIRTSVTVLARMYVLSCLLL